MLIGEIIQRIQSLYSKGVQSDDTRLSNRHIYNKMLTLRTKLITQRAKKKQKISDWNYQTIPCIKIIKVPPHECPCLPSVGCDVYRSEYKLPKPLTGLSGDLIESVSTITKGSRKIFVDKQSVKSSKWSKGNKYTSKKLSYYIEGGYLYLNTPTSIKVLSVRGLFEDPTEVRQYKGICDEDCIDCKDCIDYMEEEFPIDADLVDTLIEMSVNELIILFSKNIEDVTNDSKDSLKQQSK